jgi:hypothetical protein
MISKSVTSMDPRMRYTIVTETYPPEINGVAMTISRMAEHFQILLASILAQPNGQLNSLEMLSESQKEEQMMEKRERQESQIRKLKGIRRKAVDLSTVRDVKTTYLRPGETLPLVIQPEMDEMDLADWAGSNGSFIESNLLSHGAILFRGFNVASAPEFERFAAAVCPELFGEYGDLPRERASGKVYGSTPYPSDETILFHNESSHMHRWPMKIWFFCLKAAEQLGRAFEVGQQERDVAFGQLALRLQLRADETDGHDAVLHGRPQQAVACPVAGALVLEHHLAEPRERVPDMRRVVDRQTTSAARIDVRKGAVGKLRTLLRRRAGGQSDRHCPTDRAIRP